MKKLIFLFAIAILLAGCIQQPKTSSPPCHIDLGFDYESTPPSCSENNLVCTLEYRAGDICLKYITCEAENKTIIDQKFYGCISCYEDCALNENKTIEECDLLCGESLNIM